MLKRRVTSVSLFLIILTTFLSLLSSNCLADDNNSLFITQKMANEIAKYYVVKISMTTYNDWIGASPVEPQLYNDLDGNPAAYVYSAVKDGEYMGYVTISARTDYHPLWEYTKAPRPIYNIEDTLDRLTIYNGILDPVVNDFLFLGNWDYFVKVQDVKGEVHVSSLISTFIEPDSIVKLRNSTFISKELTESVVNSWKIARNGIPELIKNAPQASSKHCSGYSGLNGAFSWYRGCAPTSITMLLYYYGNIRPDAISALSGNVTTENMGKFGSPKNVTTCFPIHEDVCTAVWVNTPYWQAQAEGKTVGDPILPRGVPPCDDTDYNSEANWDYNCWGLYSEEAVEIIGNVTADRGVPFNEDVNSIDTIERMNTGTLEYFFGRYRDQIDENNPVLLGLGQVDIDPYTGQDYNAHAVAGIGYDYSGADHTAFVYDTWVLYERTWSLDNLYASVQNAFVYFNPPFNPNIPPVLQFGEDTLNGIEYPTALPGPAADFTFSIHYYDPDEYNPLWVAPYWGEEFDDTSVCKKVPYMTGSCRSTVNDEFSSLAVGNGVFDGERLLDSDDDWRYEFWLGESLLYDDIDVGNFNSQDFIENFSAELVNGKWDGDNGPKWGRGFVFVDDTPYPMTRTDTTQAPSNALYQATVTLYEGIHYYYFIFEDGNSGFARLPVQGTYVGPRVAESYDPELSNGKVAPTSGSPSTIFTYSVVYFDQDGDEPTLTDLEYDGTKKASMKQSPLDADGTLFKVSFSFPKDEAIGTHTFRFHFQDKFGGDTYLPSTGWFTGPIINGGEDPDLTMGTVFPQAGKPANTYTFSTHYYSKSDLDSSKIPITTKLYLDNQPYVMTYRDWGQSGASPANGTYEYSFDGLTIGTHEYYFLFTNAKGITNRYPARGSLTGPVVDVGNSPPMLYDGTVKPLSGDQLTTYTFMVTYDDDDGDPPAPNKSFVYIDGVANLMSVSSTESEANATYTYSVTGLDVGSHTYYFHFEDSYGNKTRLPILNYYEGPNVTDTNAENLPPELYVGQVVPDLGDTATPFKYTVQYFDRNEDMPFTKFVYIDGIPYEMTFESGSEYDGIYSFEMKNLQGGEHTYYFSFTDGNGGSDRLPTIGVYTGPTVVTEARAYIPYWYVNDLYGVDTWLFLSNLGIYPIDAEIAFKDLGGLDKILKRVQIDPGQLLKIDVGTLNVQGQGFGTISWDKGILNAFGIIYDFNHGNTYPLYFGSPTVNGEAFIPYWQVSQNWKIDTNLMLTNIDPTHNNVNITLKNNNNTLLNSNSVVLTGNSMRIFSASNMISQSLSGNPFEAMGSLSIDWDVGRMNIWGVTLNYDKYKGYPILYTKDRNVSPTYIPFWNVDNTKGIDTFLFINNLGQKDLMPRIVIYDKEGIVRGVSAPTIGSGCVVTVPISDYISNPVNYGSAIVTWKDNSPVKIWGTIFDMTEGDGQVLQINNNVNSVSPIHVPYFQHSAFVETNLFLSNMENTTAQVVLEFFDIDGNSSGFYNVILAPHATQTVQTSEATTYSEGRAKITWSMGSKVSVWGTIYNMASQTETALTFDTPKGSEE